jgi:hypothetical protein
MSRVLPEAMADQEKLDNKASKEFLEWLDFRGQRETTVFLDQMESQDRWVLQDPRVIRERKGQSGNLVVLESKVLLVKGEQ